MVKKIIIGVVAVVVVGAGAYLLFGNKDNGETSNSQANSSQSKEAANKNTSQEGNILSLSSGGSAKTCTFSAKTTSGSGTGTMYSDGKGRGLMNMKIVTNEGKTVMANTLLSGEKVYSWTVTDGQSRGFIFNKSSLEKKPSSDTAPSTSSSKSNVSQDYKLSCAKWTVDESMLAVPTTVTFTEMPNL